MQPLEGRQRRSRRSCRPSLEGLEARHLPSVAAVLAEPPSAGGNVVSALGTGGHITGAPLHVDPTLIPGFLQALHGPVTTTVPIQIGNQVFPPGTYAVPQPTDAEVKRESAIVKFIGRYYVGPPRFSNQASTIHIYSKGNSTASNQFLKGRTQIVLFPPADPTAQPTTNDPVAGQTVGLMSVFPNNALQTSAAFFLDVSNVPGIASNDPQALDHGLPSHLAVAIDNVSGGAYSTPGYATTPARQTNPLTGAPIPVIGGAGGAVGFYQGMGILDIKYIPDNRLRAGASSSGTVIVTMQGLFNLTGALTAIARPIN
jgi:hypothetical protein